MSSKIESELSTLQRRVHRLENKLKSWSRVFRQETVWKHNLEEWLIQHFDYNIRLQTELGFFKSSDDEDDNLDMGNATKALAKLASKKHFTSTPRKSSGFQIINCQTNPTGFSPRESNDELYMKKRRLNSYEDSHSIDIGSTTVSTVVQKHGSGRYVNLQNPSAISNSNQFDNSRITIQEVESRNTANSFVVSNSSIGQEIDGSNTIIINPNISGYEYESEESYTPTTSRCNIRRKNSREEVLSSQEENEISSSNRQFNTSSRTSASDTPTANDVLVVSDDSDSSSVVFLNNYEADRESKPPINYTHQCTSCGRKISAERVTFTHFLKLEETTCFVCQIENNHNPEGIIDPDMLETPQFGIMELLANSGVEMDAKVVKKALVKSEHWSECARLLIRNYFPRDVLRRSNAKGGERKVPGGDGSRHEPLDENVVYVIKGFVKEFWMSRGGMPLEVDKGFNRVVNKVCQRERDKVKRRQTMEDQINTSFLQQLDANLLQQN